MHSKSQIKNWSTDSYSSWTYCSSSWCWLTIRSYSSFDRVSWRHTHTPHSWWVHLLGSHNYDSHYHWWQTSASSSRQTTRGGGGGGGGKKERKEHNQHMGKSVQTFVSKSVQTFVELLRKDRPVWTLTKSGLKRDGIFSEGSIYMGIWRVWFQTSFEWRVHLHGDMKSMVSKMFLWRVHLHWDMKSMVSKRFWWRVHLHWDIKSSFENVLVKGPFTWGYEGVLRGSSPWGVWRVGFQKVIALVLHSSIGQSSFKPSSVWNHYLPLFDEYFV